MGGQPVVNLSLKDFLAGGAEHNGMIFISRPDKSLFPQARKVVLFDDLVENKRQGSVIELTNFNKKRG